ncbi:MAG: hypothetical protein QOF51_765 [Chloroflexota bacterium]|nr:hypothetical protein [Chloroflexota bacterium]
MLALVGASRLAIELVAILTNRLLPRFPDFGRDSWDLRPEPVSELITSLWTRFDSGFYISVGFNGYMKPDAIIGAPDWHFFPAYAWAMALPARLLGGPAAAPYVGLMVSLAGLLIGALALRELARDQGAPGITTVAFLLAFPTSFFLSAVYSEGLFFGSEAVSLFLIGRRRFWWAGAAAAVAAATRPPGFLLVIPLGVAWLAVARSRPHPWSALPAVLLPLLGLGVVMLTLYLQVGDPLGFIHDQYAWNRQAMLPWAPLLDGMATPASDISPWSWYLPPLDTAVALLALGTSGYLVWQRRFGLGLLGLALALLPLSSGSLLSMTRYMAVNVPMFVALGMLAGRPEWLRTSVLVSLAILEGFALTLFIVGVHSVA